MKILFQKISAAPLIATLVALVSIWFAPITMAAVTEVIAAVDKNPVIMDESFTLEIVADDDVSTDAFDPSPLLKDFVVGRTSTSKQTQVINFDMARTTRWSTVLIPREAGRFTIPSFDIEGVSSQPVYVQVLPVSQSKHAQAQGIYITTELDMDEVYLLQQVKYTVKLHIALDLQRGSLSAPTMDNGDIEQVGDDKEYNDVVNGRRYRIIERVFSIIPQKSGTYAIQAPYFEGEVLDNSRQRFGFFNRTKAINKVGKNLFLKVRPIPDNYTHHWLPSEHVEIHDEWQGMESSLKVGEPATRTITLTALGVVESQLPEINSAYPSEVKTYPDQAETATVQRNGTLVAQRKESIAIIPNKEGIIVIPEVKIPWFNVVTGSTEYAVLPKKELSIQAAMPSGSEPVAVPVKTSIENEPTGTTTANLPVGAVTTSWWSISSWVLLLIWLLTLLAWWLTRNSKRQAKTAVINDIPHNSEAKLWRQVQEAIKQRDEQNLTNYLQHWLAELSGNPQQSLSKSVAQANNDRLSQQITDLFGNRFGENKRQQSTQDLFNALMETLITVRKQYQQRPKNKGTTLHPLYPNTQ